MRKIALILAVLLLALSAAMAVPALTPYVGGPAIAPKLIAGIALLLLVLLVADHQKATSSAPTSASPVEAAKPAAPMVAPVSAANQFDAEIVSFLGVLQERGRFIDFMMDDITSFTDTEVGAAGRVLHEGCKAVLLEHFGIKPIRDEGEGSSVTVSTGYAPDDYRLVGKITGEAPFTGTLIHHGWKAEWVKLPRLARTGSDRLPTIAPAEVELR